MNPRALLVEMYGAFNARDVERILAAMTPDVDWPNGLDGGRIHGREAVRDYWLEQWSVIDPRVEPVAFTTDADGRMVVEVQQVIRNMAGHITAERVVEHVYEFRDGLIARMEIRSR